MMRAIATTRHIRHIDQRPKGIVIKTVCGEEIFMLVIARASPEVADLLRLDVAGREGRA